MARWDTGTVWTGGAIVSWPYGERFFCLLSSNGAPFARWLVAMNSTRKLGSGFRIKSFFDWLFAVVSFLIFLALEGALLYVYFVYMSKL
jgi:hypothetical protein